MRGTISNRPSASGQVILSRYDLVARVVSGTFEIMVWNTEGDTIRLTEGRFGVRM